MQYILLVLASCSKFLTRHFTENTFKSQDEPKCFLRNLLEQDMKEFDFEILW